MKAGKGRRVGDQIMHFACNYCSKKFQGPSSGTVLKHLRSTHPGNSPELLLNSLIIPAVSKRGFFDNQKMKMAFDPDIFMGLLLKWIVKSDQPFSTVENQYFEELLGYLKKDITVHSRRTIMRRLEELYLQTKLVTLHNNIRILCKNSIDLSLNFPLHVTYGLQRINFLSLDSLFTILTKTGLCKNVCLHLNIWKGSTMDKVYQKQ